MAVKLVQGGSPVLCLLDAVYGMVDNGVVQAEVCLDSIMIEISHDISGQTTRKKYVSIAQHWYEVEQEQEP